MFLKLWDLGIKTVCMIYMFLVLLLIEPILLSSTIIAAYIRKVVDRTLDVRREQNV